MTQKQQDDEQIVRHHVSITEEDVDRMVDSYIEAHPESSGSSKVDALKGYLHQIEQQSDEAVIEHKLDQRSLLTSIATNLSGSGALGLVAAVIAPELPFVTIGAAIVGLVVSDLLAQKVDKLSE